MTDFISVLGKPRAEVLRHSLLSLEQGGANWQTLLLSLLQEALDSQGVQGLVLAKQLLKAIFSKEKPSIDWLSPRSASDTVARLQQLEAQEQTEVLRWFAQLGHALTVAGGGVSLGILKGLF